MIPIPEVTQALNGRPLSFSTSNAASDTAFAIFGKRYSLHGSTWFPATSTIASMS